MESSSDTRRPVNTGFTVAVVVDVVSKEGNIGSVGRGHDAGSRVL